MCNTNSMNIIVFADCCCFVYSSVSRCVACVAIWSLVLYPSHTPPHTPRQPHPKNAGSGVYPRDLKPQARAPLAASLSPPAVAPHWMVATRRDPSPVSPRPAPRPASSRPAPRHAPPEHGGFWRIPSTSYQQSFIFNALQREPRGFQALKPQPEPGAGAASAGRRRRARPAERWPMGGSGHARPPRGFHVYGGPCICAWRNFVLPCAN